MAINTILKIDGRVMSRVIKSYKVAENLTWADAGRNMAGTLRADFVGEFPKIEVEFRDGLTLAQVQNIAEAVRKPFFEVEFFSPVKGAMERGVYYRNDYTIEMLDPRRELFKGFSINLIPKARRQ